MNIQKDFSLINYNTFRVPANTKLFAEISTIDELQAVIQQFQDEPKLVLGGGSNIIFKSDFDGLVIKPNILGKKLISENSETVLVESAAGENWDEFVHWTVQQNLGGLENLSLIPGNVGTCPVQNIGAYGVEIKDSFEYLVAVNLQTGVSKKFTKKECAFGYRDSAFKNQEKGKWCIVSVAFLLSKNPQPQVSYGAIQKTLEQAGIQNPTIADVRNAIVQIRTEKLPDPKKVGNCGSFFKNPIVSRKKFEAIQKEYPDMPFYELSENQIKIPAGWMIDVLGLKGKKFGTVGVHTKQALVLINLGQATGNDVRHIAQKIQKLIQEKFDIELEIEVNIL